MKKIIAFVSSLVMVAPSFAQTTTTKDNKTQGVSKVKQQDVNKTPATTPAKQGAVDHKNATNTTTIKLSQQTQKTSGGGK